MRRLIVTLFAIFALLAPYSSFSATNTEGERGRPSGDEIKDIYTSYLPSEISNTWRQINIAAHKMQDQNVAEIKEKLPKNLSEEEMAKQIKTKRKSLFRCRFVVIFNKTEYLDDIYRARLATICFVMVPLIMFLWHIICRHRPKLNNSMSFDDDGSIFKNE